MTDYMKDANKSAYPLGMNGVVMQEGLSKRELFAAMAMQGIMANEKIYREGSDMLDKRIKESSEQVAKQEYLRTLAVMSIEQADALIAELNREANL